VSSNAPEVRAAAASGFYGIRGGLVVVVVFFDGDGDEDERFQVQIDHLHHIFNGV
jgi:hypothetical protein